MISIAAKQTLKSINTTPLLQNAIASTASKTFLQGMSIRSLSYALNDMKGRHFLSIDELSNLELAELLRLSKTLKSTYGSSKNINTSTPKPLTNHSVSMIFQKRSTRTRVSTETGMFLLGGHALFLGPSDVQLGVNESMRDTSNVLSRFNTHVLARVFSHDDVLELSKYANVPVINALSDLHHPLQTLADLMTLEEKYGQGNLKGKTIAWVGDGNNVLHDLMLGAAKVGMNVRVATPKGYEANPTIVQKTKEIATSNNTLPLYETTIAKDAVSTSDVVVTDTWVSMGEEDVYEQKIKEFEGYQVNKTLMECANEDAVFLHCLPRHQEEVSDEVFYSGQSLVFPEAENRMWTVMAVLVAQAGKSHEFK